MLRFAYRAVKYGIGTVGLLHNGGVSLPIRARYHVSCYEAHSCLKFTNSLENASLALPVAKAGW